MQLYIYAELCIVHFLHKNSPDSKVIIPDNSHCQGMNLIVFYHFIPFLPTLPAS